MKLSKVSIWTAMVLIGTFLFPLSILGQKKDLNFEHFTDRPPPLVIRGIYPVFPVVSYGCSRLRVMKSRN